MRTASLENYITLIPYRNYGELHHFMIYIWFEAVSLPKFDSISTVLLLHAKAWNKALLITLCQCHIFLLVPYFMQSMLMILLSLEMNIMVLNSWRVMWVFIFIWKALVYWGILELWWLNPSKKTSVSEKVCYWNIYVSI